MLSAAPKKEFSKLDELADQWYDLHNSDQATKLLVVRFSTRREDFPPNLDSLAIKEVVLYFACAARPLRLLSYLASVIRRLSVLRYFACAACTTATAFVW